MTLLALGILLFAVVHFIPSLTPDFRTQCMARVGEGGYKGIFSLLLLVSLTLIIVGWRSAEVSYIYQPPAGLHTAALALMCLAFVIMSAGSRNSRIRRVVRHPQLAGVALWGISHLFLNGDNRAVLLFGAMATWAILEILAISKREGAWIKEEAPSWGAELVTLLIAAITIAVLVYVHPWLSGVPVY